MNDQIFLGAMVLDQSARTNKQKVADLLNLVVTPFNHIGVSDILERPVFESRAVTPEDVVSGLVVMGSMQQPDTRYIPSKTACAMSWLRGRVTSLAEVERIYSGKSLDETETSSQEAATKLLLRINSDRHLTPEPENYTQRVHSRVTDLMGGQWCSTLMYLGPKPIISLAQRNQMMHFSVVTLDNCMILVWSTEMDAVNELLTVIPDGNSLDYLKRAAWVNNIAILHEKNTVVLHPMYLLSKVRKWGQAHNFNPLKVMTTLEQYLNRSSY